MLFVLFAICQGYASQDHPFEIFFETDIDTFISEMSPEQKLGQILIFGFWGINLDDDYQEWIKTGKLGNIKIFLRNVQSKDQLKKLTHDITVLADSDGNGIPPFIATDLEGGIVNHIRSPGITRAPSAGLIGATTYAENNRNVSRLIALTLSELGINMNFAPCADVLTNPENIVISTRSYSSDPNLVSAMVKSFVEEQKNLGILSTAKHFPGHGMTDFDSHHQSDVVSTSRREMDQIHLLPYKLLLNENLLDGCMVSHIIYSAYDPVYPAAFSPEIVNTLLRKDMDFEGVIVTDDLEMKGSQFYAKSIEDAFILAFNAGNDLLLISHTKSKQELIFERILELLLDGTLSMELLDSKVYRILRMKKEYLSKFYAVPNRQNKYEESLLKAWDESVLAMNEGIVQISSNIKSSIPLFLQEALKKKLNGLILAPTQEFSSLAKQHLTGWDIINIGYLPDRKKNMRNIQARKDQLRTYDIIILGLANERHSEWAQTCIEEEIPFGILSIGNPFSSSKFSKNALFIVASFDPYSPGLDALFTTVFKTGQFSGTFPYYF